MKSKITICILLCFVCFSCRIFFFDPDHIIQNEWDLTVVPDKYNTGVPQDAVLTKFSGSGNIADNVFISFRTDMTPNQFNLSYSSSKNLPDRVVIKNIDFSDYDFVVLGTHNYPRTKYITFENCKFKGFRNEAVEKGQSRIYFTFNRCSFSGGVTNSYITLNNCQIGGFVSDAINPLREFYANNLYIYNLFHKTNDDYKHVDGIQIFGDPRSRNHEVNGFWYSTVERGEIHFKNLRFEIPALHFSPLPKETQVNSCIMVQLEYSDVDDISFETVYANGGYYFPLRIVDGVRADHSEKGLWSHKNLLFKDIMVSNNYKTPLLTQYKSNDHEVTNVGHHNQLFVSSVWKDKNGTAHIIVSNDTKTDKVLTVKTDKKTYTFKIPHCPSDYALNEDRAHNKNPDEKYVDNNGKAYTEYTWEDMPFDLDMKISGDPAFVLCYDGNEKIRYVNFDGKPHYYSDLK